MRYGVDFTVEAIPKRCHGHKRKVNPSLALTKVMDTSLEIKKQFKNSIESAITGQSIRERKGGKRSSYLSQNSPVGENGANNFEP